MKLLVILALLGATATLPAAFEFRNAALTS